MMIKARGSGPALTLPVQASNPPPRHLDGPFFSIWLRQAADCGSQADALEAPPAAVKI